MTRPCPCCSVIITTSCTECGWPGCSCTQEMRRIRDQERMRAWVWDKLSEVRSMDPMRDEP